MGVEPMNFQIPVGRSNHLAMRDAWWARSYTRFLYVKNSIIVQGVTSCINFFKKKKKPLFWGHLPEYFKHKWCKTEQIKIIEVSSGDKLLIYWPRCRYFQVKVKFGKALRLFRCVRNDRVVVSNILSSSPYNLAGSETRPENKFSLRSDFNPLL